jgi:hypothetical protein
VPGLSRRSVDLLNARSGRQLYIGRVKWETDLKIRQDFVFDIARVIIQILLQPKESLSSINLND